MAMKKEAMKKEVKPVETILVEDPSSLPGKLQRIGGSKSDTWNNVIANQAVQTVWAKNSDEEERKNLFSATIAGLIGIGPVRTNRRDASGATGGLSQRLYGMLPPGHDR